ncbi:hypothetical protein LBYZC6_20100 [Lacrimispora brassicae]
MEGKKMNNERMKLPKFLKEVDALSKNLSHENMEMLIHEIARTWPENRRNNLLQLMRSYENISESESCQKCIDDGISQIILSIESIKERLTQINSAGRLLESEYNEEWDDWYNSDVDEVLFSDPKGILKDINEAMELIHACVDRELYKEGYELSEILSVLEVSSEGDYCDYNGSPLYMYELDQYNLLGHAYIPFVKECLYLTYMGNQLEDRADEIYCMMGNFRCNDVKLEEVMQSGNDELPQFDAFLPMWIGYLGTQKSKSADKLLREAQSMIQDESCLLENARKYVTEHPSLYQQFLEIKLNSDESDSMFQIGIEAMEKIPSSYLIRSEIALLTAEYAVKLNDHEKMEKCWIEAFRSETTVVNYMRIRICSNNWKQWEQELKFIIEQTYQKTKNREKSLSYDMNAKRENYLYQEGYCTMLFFEEQFERMYSVGMHEKNALGWSSTFMKQGLAFMFLLLFQGEKFPEGMKAMQSRAKSVCEISADKFYRGTEINSKLSDNELFSQLFNSWKNEVQLTIEESKKWLGKIEKWIAGRVTGIMEGNHRNYYGECASFIAAFGEVQESLGIPDAKAHIMEKYRNEYSRLSAFRKELVIYGMKK